MKTNSKCIRCLRDIDKNKDNYIQITEWYKNKAIRINYAHKVCWESLMDSKSKVNEAFGMFRGLKHMMTNQGLIPAEEYKIT